MSRRDLRGHLAAYYEKREPDGALVTSLMARIEAAPEAPSRRWSPRFALVLAAAALVLAAVGFGVLMPAGPEAPSPLAREIAAHHLHRLDPEFRTASFAELQKAMDRLDFALINPERLAAEGFRLIGGRYCSVRGRLAAELTVVDSKGQVSTLCLARWDGSMGPVPTEPVTVDGLRVQAWVEKGLLVALAVPA